MNELQIFNYQQKEVRTVIKDGEPWFVATDVCEVLEISNSSDAISRLSDSMKGVASTDTLGGNQNCRIISEAGVYKLVFTSRKAEAERFTDWLATEVIPSIRRTGSYSLVQDSYMIENPIERAQCWIEEQKEKQALLLSNKQKDQLIGELKPKADYTDNILKNKGLVTITQIAKDYGMSPQEMNSRLHDMGVQYKQSGQWLLYEKYQDKGYTQSETVPIIRTGGWDDVKMNTKWRQKGRLFIYELLKKEGILPVIEKDS